MPFEKEKNFARIRLENGKTYTIDINEGVIYGVRGTPLKTIPCHKELANEVRCDSTLTNYSLRELLYNILHFYSSAEIIKDYAFSLKLADRLDSLGIAHSLSCRMLTAQEKLTVQNYFAPYIKYIRENNYDFSITHSTGLLAYARNCELEKQYKAICGQYQHQISLEQFKELCDILEHDGEFSAEEYKIALATAAVCKLCDYSKVSHGHETIHQLARYITFCREMGVQPQKLTNFTREYAETYASYQAYKTKNGNELIKKNYARHSKAWQFTFENCVVLAPSCAQDIVLEGQKMHHCVGGYVDEVIENRTYICFVRHAENPDEPYITCEVNLNGEIRQYFLSHDRRISSAEDKRFYEAFRNYLNEIWTTEDAVK